MQVTIKKLSPVDLSLAKKLIKQWQIDDRITDPSLPGDDYLTKLLSKNSFHVLVALQDNKVVGGLTAYELEMFGKEQSEVFFYEIGVSEKYRRKGIGKRLIGELKRICAEKGIREIFVATSMDNEAAKQLYKSTGGQIEVAPLFTYDLNSD